MYRYAIVSGTSVVNIINSDDSIEEIKNNLRLGSHEHVVPCPYGTNATFGSTWDGENFINNINSNDLEEPNG